MFPIQAKKGVTSPVGTTENQSCPNKLRVGWAPVDFVGLVSCYFVIEKASCGFKEERAFEVGSPPDERPWGSSAVPTGLLNFATAYPGFHPGLLSVVPAPDFLRPLVDTNEPHAAFLDESRTRSRGLGQLTGNQGTGLVPFSRRLGWRCSLRMSTITPAGMKNLIWTVVTEDSPG
jgi:hypothetical protein